MKLNKSLLLTAVIVFGLVLTVGLMAASFNYLINAQHETFDNQSKHLADKFTLHIEEVKTEIKGLATAFYAMPQIESNSLQNTSEFIFTQHPAINKTLYAPIVSHSQRLRFESNQHEEGYISFAIHDRHQTGNQAIKKATQRHSYLPISQIEPFNVDNVSLLGLDLFTNPGFKNAITHAIKTGDDVALIGTLAGDEEHLWLFKAIYAGFSGRSDPYFFKHSTEMVNAMVAIAVDVRMFIDLPSATDAMALRLTAHSSDDAKIHSRLLQFGNQDFLTIVIENDTVKIGTAGITFLKSVSVPLHGQNLILSMSRHLSWFDGIFLLFFVSGVIGTGFTLLLIFATRALLKSEHRNAAVLNSALDAIISIDEHGLIQAFNPAAETMFGYSSNEALGESLADLIIPEQARQHYKTGLNHYLETGESQVLGTFVELKAIRKGGEEFSAEVNVVEVVAGKHRVFTAFLRDLSKRKKAQAELAQLATVVEQSYNAIMITDTEGTIQYVNPAFEKMSGFSSSEALGKNPNIVSSGEHDDSYFADMWASIQAHNNWSGSFINKAKDGSVYHVEQTIFPIYIDQEHVGYTSVQLDVTERDQLQEHSEHTQRLESLGVLAGGIAHDFNNLLTAIMGNTGLARNQTADHSPTLKYLNNIQQASESAATLCQQMLAYSGKGHFIIQPLNLSDSISSIVQLLESSIAKRVQLDINLDHHLPAIEADEGQMQQVIMNLVINASEAIGNQVGCIQITTSQVSLNDDQIRGLLAADDMQAGKFIALQVKDDGCGMDDVTRKKIFDPFFTTKFAGRGLGMSAMLGIIRGHTGGLKVASTLHQGTQFDVYFPASNHIIEQRSTQPTQCLVNKQIQAFVLVVDDEEMLRDVAASILKDMGIMVILAEDGLHALQQLQDHPIDLVLLDITMPRMGGEECFQQLRELNPELDVLICSGYAESEVKDRFNTARHIDFIQKPYLPEILEEKVKTILSQQ